MNKGIQQSTVDFVREEEGFRNDVYKDIAGKDTVGVGHLVLPTDGLSHGDTISNTEVDSFLKQDLKIAEAQIKKDVKVPLNQNQFDALISLVFNIGIGAFNKSTLLKFINQEKEEQDIRNAWMAWKFVKGSQSNALESRRERELELYFS